MLRSSYRTLYHRLDINYILYHVVAEEQRTVARRVKTIVVSVTVPPKKEGEGAVRARVRPIYRPRAQTSTLVMESIRAQFAWLKTLLSSVKDAVVNGLLYMCKTVFAMATDQRRRMLGNL